MTLLTTDDMFVTTNAAPEGTGEYFRAGDGVLHSREISATSFLSACDKVYLLFLYNDKITTSSYVFDIGTLYDIPDIL